MGASSASGISAYSAYAYAQPKVAANYGGWLYTYFGANAPVSQTADTADPTNDGLSNLLKYALGLNPLIPGTFHPAITHSGGTWQMTYQRPANRPDLTYATQVSPDLSNTSWTSTGVTTTKIVSGDPETWQSTFTPPSGSECFFRLWVSRL